MHDIAPHCRYDSSAYVVLTAARNEECFIEQTIRSLASQSAQPTKWVIVSDNSTDRTDELVLNAAREYSWIELLRTGDDRVRGFDAKARAINWAYAHVADLDFEIVANMDADVSFDSDFCKYLLERFAEDPGLGVAGTPYEECGSKRYSRSQANRVDVPGQVQFWRRACFDAVGGYTPLPRGGVDTVAVTQARMLGWRTRVFGDRCYSHHRLMGTGGRSDIAAGLMRGERAYRLGGHPAWETLRAMSHVAHHPYVLGTACELVGFWQALLTGLDRSVSDEMMAFRRREQGLRLRRMILGDSSEPDSTSEA